MRNWFLKNFWLKLTSVVLATLIWLTVQANLEKENRQVYQTEESADDSFRRARLPRQFEVPVEVRWDGTNCSGFQALPQKVLVSMEGETVRMNAMDAKDLTAFVETGGAPDTRGIYPIQIIAPSHLHVSHLMPHSVRLKSLPAAPAAPTDPR